MAKEYVEKRNGGYYLLGSRVSLDSVVYAFLRGESTEGISESFPSLSLEEIFGALTFYLANRDTVDRYLQESRTEFVRLREAAQREHPEFYARLKAARQSAQSPSA